MEYTIWDKSTEIIVKSGSSNAPEAEPLRPGWGLLLGAALNDELYRVTPDGVPYEFVAPPTREQLIQQIELERARRLSVGFDYNFGDERGVHRIGTSEKDMLGWARVTSLKDTLFQAGDATSLIGVVTDTGPVSVTGPEWNMLMLYAAVNFEQPIWAASFALQSRVDLTSDLVTDDASWP